MRKYIWFIVIAIFAGCEKPGDCFKSTGAMVMKEVFVPDFTKIVVNKGIALVIKQGDDYKVEVHSGENLINDIEVNVVAGVLMLEDNTTCNWTRDYGETTVVVTAPNLTDVYSKTELSIKSDGALAYDDLHLYAMDSYDTYSGTGTGDFFLQFDNVDNVSVDINSVSRLYLSGQTQNLNIAVYASGGIVYAQELTAQTVHVFHRGSNDIYVHPIESIMGDIYSIGNVISVTRPPQVQVVEHYDGKLIFY